MGNQSLNLLRVSKKKPNLLTMQSRRVSQGQRFGQNGAHHKLINARLCNWNIYQALLTVFTLYIK